MLADLRDDSIRLTAELRATHSVWDEYGDFADASRIENRIDEAKGRIWFLHQASRSAESA
jgi:starvation-inducible DNA-binding protein